MDCDEEREGYVNPIRPAYPVIPTSVIQAKREHRRLSFQAEQGIGLLITVGGGAWAVYTTVVEHASIWQVQFTPPGPVEICALGIVVWLHAKWRHSAKTE